MKKILGIFRGFPGLGRVVSGVSILETLKKDYNCQIEMISYLQGKKYLELKGYDCEHDVVSADYCSIGLLPTNRMGAYIHKKIVEFSPDAILVDGEPLILQSLKISHPSIKIISLLNPSDVDNPQNDKEAMDFFNAIYALSDLTIIHGLRTVTPQYGYKKYISVNTIIRNEILKINNSPSNNIYCVLGGGTVNVERSFVDSTIRIAELCKSVASRLADYNIHIICSSQNIYESINSMIGPNVIIHKDVLKASDYYSDACLIITRSGRNTLSEIAYLSIPTISFVTGCMYRKEEQQHNANSINQTCSYFADTSIGIVDFTNLCKSALNAERKYNSFETGNAKAIESIINLLGLS